MEFSLRTRNAGYTQMAPIGRACSLNARRLAKSESTSSHIRPAFSAGRIAFGNVVEALKETLALDGVLAANRIIFVAHSMGGIVVRRYIVQRASELMEFGTEIWLFLVASPSLGSSYANWLAPIARFMGHQQAAALTFSQKQLLAQRS